MARANRIICRGGVMMRINARHVPATRLFCAVIKCKVFDKSAFVALPACLHIDTEAFADLAAGFLKNPPASKFAIEKFIQFERR